MGSVDSARVDLLPAQRHARIIEHLRRDTVASIRELTLALGASDSTVRRDLCYLVAQGYLDRTHGGAIIRNQPSARFEPDQCIAAEMERPRKQAIGALAAQRVVNGHSVILDASSTVKSAAASILDRELALTVVTNDLNCAQMIARSQRGSVTVTGGTIRPGTTTLIGEPARGFLSGVHVDVAFVGVHTISDGVFTETSLEVAGMKRRMIGAAKRVIVLADSAKFAPPSFCEICRFDEVDEVITDAGASAAQIEAVRSAGCSCTVADVTVRRDPDP